MYGSDEVAAPRYDLALLAPRLFREPAQEVRFESPVTPGAANDEGAGQRRFFWMAIGAIALVLMLLLARLLKPLSQSGPL